MQTAHETAPSTVTELHQRIEEQWDLIHPHYCRHLIESMPRRISAIDKAKGLWTKY